MQPIVNYGGYIPGRAPTPEMLNSGAAVPQYILDRKNNVEKKLKDEREEILQKERKERERREEEERKVIEYEKIREEVRRTEMEKLREELRRTEMEGRKKSKGRASAAKK